MNGKVKKEPHALLTSLLSAPLILGDKAFRVTFVPSSSVEAPIIATQEINAHRLSVLNGLQREGKLRFQVNGLGGPREIVFDDLAEAVVFSMILQSLLGQLVA